METFDAIIEAGQMAEMSNTKQSRGVAEYYLNEVLMQPDQIPTMSYGLQSDRLAEAPPTDLVDTESQLKNQFDILGKSGYVYNRSRGNEHSNKSFMKPTLQTPEKVAAFFNPISGRDFNKFSKKSCGKLNAERVDLVTVLTPGLFRFDHVDTRAMMKNKTDECK